MNDKISHIIKDNQQGQYIYYIAKFVVKIERPLDAYMHNVKSFAYAYRACLSEDVSDRHACMGCKGAKNSYFIRGVQKSINHRYDLEFPA